MPEPVSGAKAHLLRSLHAALKGRASTIHAPINALSRLDAIRDHGGPLQQSKLLLFEVRAHDRKVVLGQAAYDFLREVIAARRNGVAVALLERGAALIDVFFQAVVEIFIAAAFVDLRLVVQLDLIDQQASEALRLAVSVGVFGG